MLNLNITLSNFLATFEAEIMILPQGSEAEMKDGVASENKNVYLNINIFILTIYIDLAFTLPFTAMLPLHRNQSTDLQSESLRRFLYNGNTRLKQANLNHNLFHILFSPFMKKVFSPFPECPI